MKATRKLIPALAMLLVSAIVMSSASFAWFTMSRQVTAQGMNVTVTAPNNLLIKKTGEADTTYAELNSQGATAVKLVPASSSSGLASDIYSVQDGEALNAADGSLFMTADKKTKLQLATAAVDGGAAGGYYDFKYTLKTEGTEAVKVVVTKVEAKKNTADTNENHSVAPVRVAVLLANGTAHAANPVFNAGQGTNLNDGKVVDSIADGTGVPTLTAEAMTYATTATSNTDDNYVVEVPANGTPVDIIVRVWYEGQDKDCVVLKGANAIFDIEVVLTDVKYLSN